MTISELRDRVHMLPTLESKMALLQEEMRKAEEETSEMLRRYEKENRDVEKLQKESFSSFLLRLLSKYEDKLEKEQCEEINAKLAYDRAETRLKDLVKEKAEISGRIAALRSDKKAYQNELAKRRIELAGRITEPSGLRFEELEKERGAIIAQMSEIGEALRTADYAKATVFSALESLESAEGWATFDAFTRGGIISHMAKYSHIDDAEGKFSLLSSQLRDLNSELNDVHGLSAYGMTEISSVQRAVDFWFDNIFTDLSVRGQIKDNAGEIRRLLGGINTVVAELKSKLIELEARLTENSRLEEELLSSI